MKTIINMYKTKQARLYGLYYPMFVIAMCMLAEWLERQY